MVETFDQYLKQRIINVALNRKQVKRVSVSTIPLEAITPRGESLFKVKSQADDNEEYNVDLSIGMCTYPKGKSGAVCKHQTACVEHNMTFVPQMFIPDIRGRRWLAAVALGDARTPSMASFKPLNNLAY